MCTATKCFLLLSLFFISTTKASFIPVYDAASASPYVVAYVPIVYEPTAVIALNSQVVKDENNDDVGNDDGAYKPPASADENGLWQPMPGNEGEYVEELSTTEATTTTTTTTIESSTSETTSENSIEETTTTARASTTPTVVADASSAECGPDGDDGADGGDGPDGPDGSKGGKGGKAGKGGCSGRGGDGGDGGDAGDAPMPPNEQPANVVVNDAINNIIIE